LQEAFQELALSSVECLREKLPPLVVVDLRMLRAEVVVSYGRLDPLGSDQ
jgi:hypothetical protein